MTQRRPLDSEAVRVDDSGAHIASPFKAAAGEDGLTAPTPRRRPPHKAEQERRVEWGKWWGAETKKVYDQLAKGME